MYLLPRIGRIITSVMGSGPVKGIVSLYVEPLVAEFIRPFPAQAAGGSLVTRYTFLTFGRWLPYIDVRGGMLWTNLAPRIAEQSTPV